VREAVEKGKLFWFLVSFPYFFPGFVVLSLPTVDRVAGSDVICGRRGTCSVASRLHVTFQAFA